VGKAKAAGVPGTNKPRPDDFLGFEMLLSDEEKAVQERVRVLSRIA
jgi:hypothetical protein